MVLMPLASDLTMDVGMDQHRDAIVLKRPTGRIVDVPRFDA
jgi:hypothetical protein